MQPLFEQQDNFVDTINHGPAMLDPELFFGPSDRVLLGLKAHANTISHARLVALEDSFPRTRQAMGDARFNMVSREYCQAAAARETPVNLIGEGFANFLKGEGEGGSVIDLARIEWAWLISYHAAEAQAMELSMLAGIDEEALMQTAISRHPAAILIDLAAPLSPELGELAEIGTAKSILLTRPDAEVKLWPVTMNIAALFRSIGDISSMSNLLAISIEQEENGEPLDPVIRLIEAGAIMITGQITGNK